MENIINKNQAIKRLFSFLKILSIVFLIYSCSISDTYYQVIETKFDKNINENTFENNELRVKYDFWDNYGTMNFMIYNKTNKPYFVNLERCHFIYNGQSFDYFDENERVSSSYIETGTEHTKTNITNNTVNQVSKNIQLQIQVADKFKMKKILEIPPHSYIILNKFKIFESLYEICDFNDRPKKMVSIEFKKDSTPANFRNYLTYDSTITFSTPKIVDNEFWINKISNMPEDLFLIEKYSDDCNREKKIIYIRKYKTPSTFYIKYLIYYNKY